jgi:uncharacterized delta-60 repeat protein
MYFIKLRTKNNILLLTITILILTVVSATFGTLNLSANTNNNQQEQAHKLSLQNRQRKETVHRSQTKQAGFLGKENISSVLFAQNKPVLEILAAGDLDTTFGTGGKVTTQIGSTGSEALAIALQTDGKFVAAGYSSNGANIDFALARYNSNGSLDTAFGNGGKVITDIGSADNASLALAIQTDGKVIAAGNSFNGTDDDFALVRYNSNGTLDNTFGTGGIVTTNFNNSSETIDAITIQTDGKIVAAGYRLNGSFFDFALARYNSNGTLDETFGTGGKVTTGFSEFDDLARAIVLQTDGKIVVSGEADTDFAVARYNSNGSLDTTFDGDGRVRTSINLFDSAYDVAIQSDGKIVAAGETGNGNNSDFALIRYESGGALDSTFDGDGIVTTAIGASDEFASSLALQTNGKIVVGGFSFNGSNDDFALVRYNTNGSLDSTFGAGGKVTTDFSSSSNDYISALAIQSGNRVIGVGSANTNFAAAAYSLGTTNCTYSLSPTSADFPSAGGTGSFLVTTEAGCSFTAVSNSEFITITGGSTGSGSGTINFSVALNSSAARTGTITLDGQTFTINQALGVKSRKRARFF